MMYDISKWTNPIKIKTKLHTGGSTGEPLTYYEDEVGVNFRAQAHNRGWLWSGFDQEKDRRAIITSLRGSTGKKGLTLKISGHPEEKNMLSILDQIKKFKPVQIRGYVSSLYIIAEWIHRNNYKIQVPSINLIAEQVYSHIRKAIEVSFNGKAYEEYVCCDGGASGWSLDSTSNLYQTMERAYIWKDPKDENHLMRVTDLINKATVFINYENGDSVYWLKRSKYNKRNLNSFNVVGRDNDIIVLPECKKISPSFLLHWVSHVLTSKNKFIQFKAIQYIQDEVDHTRVDIVRDKGYDKEDEKTLIKTLNEICEGMRITINYVDILEKTISGKIKFIINTVE